uniref:C-type lectin domain-containing protein n=1 Tax=Urocitellus parryii TaxID=9999 RepID=A0A8D2KB42_UROPR
MHSLRYPPHPNLHSSFDPIPLCISLYPGEDIQKEQASPRISCPRGSKAYASYCSLLFSCFPTMQLACQKRSEGYLASVLSGAEASFVSSLVKSSVNSYSYVWIGLHDPTLGQEPNGAGWEWSSTDVLNYANWERNPSTASDRGYCGGVSRSSGKWRDYSCDRELPYVCKFKG